MYMLLDLEIVKIFKKISSFNWNEVDIQESFSKFFIQ